MRDDQQIIGMEAEPEYAIPLIAMIIGMVLMQLLGSCAPYIDTKHGIVSSGMLSTVQGFSGKAKMADGSTVTWSIVGYDGTTVANNAMMAVTTGLATKYAFKTTDSNNAASVSKNASDNSAAVQQSQIKAASTNPLP